MMSGWMPMDLSSLTECWVGLVFTSWAAEMYGTRLTWITRVLPGPCSLRYWRMASTNAWPSMSPMVPPSSVITTSAWVCSSMRRKRSLISLVTCGMTWTVPPRKSPARSREMSDW